MSNSKMLTALRIKDLTVPGRYGDGMGLMLPAKPTGARSWIRRTTFNRKRRDFGHGGHPAASLATIVGRTTPARQQHASEGMVIPPAWPENP